VANLEVVAPRHWRREVHDVATTIREAGARRDVTVRTDAAAAVAALVRAVRPGGPVAWILSDAGQPLGARLGLRPRAGDAVIRLWWNRGDEIDLAPGDVRRGATHVCFFADAVSAEQATRMDVAVVPYAFAPPIPAVSTGGEPFVTYTGEVDVSDACFPGGDGSPEASSTWELAEAIVHGDLSMVEAAASVESTDADARSTIVWALRNKVRFLLVKTVSEAFPGRLRLRGDDWVRAGFVAEPTSHRRRLRFEDYQRHRVSLDLGSKSTNAPLYPRSAEIMSVGGGLVQFGSGERMADAPAALLGRQASSGPELVKLIDAVLAAPAAVVLEQNLAIQAWYEALRLSAGERITDIISLALERAQRPGGST
jgi:hypothetical protein